MSTHTSHKNMKMKYILGLMLASQSISMQAQDRQTFSLSPDIEEKKEIIILSLEQCKKLALENNSTLRNARNSTTAAELQKKEAFTHYFPQISAMGFGYRANKPIVEVELNDMFSALPEQLMSAIPPGVIPSSIELLENGIVGAVTAVQPIFAGGQIVNGNNLAKVGLEVSRLQQQAQENKVELSTEQYYWQIVSLKEKLKTLDAVNTMLKQIEKDANNAVKAGVAMSNDLLQVQLKVNEIESQRLKVENGLSISKQLLAQHIGKNGEQIEVETEMNALPDFPFNLRQDNDSSLHSSIEYQLLEKNVEANELKKKMEVGKNLPTVGIGASYAYNDLIDKQHFGMLFASVSVPISGWWAGIHAIKRQKLALENAKEQLQSNGELLTIGINNSWNNVETSYKQLQLSQKGIDQAKENLRLNNNYYKAGICSISDVLQAHQQYQQTCDRYVDAYIDYETNLLKYRQATSQ